jgi:hypothetical protein
MTIWHRLPRLQATRVTTGSLSNKASTGSAGQQFSFVAAKARRNEELIKTLAGVRHQTCAWRICASRVLGVRSDRAEPARTSDPPELSRASRRLQDVAMKSRKHTKNFQNSYRFIAGPDARVIMSGGAPAAIGPWHERNVQINSPRDLCASLLKIPTQSSRRQPQPQCSRPFGRKCATWPETTAARCKINNLHDRYPEIHETARHSVAKTLRPLFGTHFRSRQSSPGFPHSDRPRYLRSCFDEGRSL